MRLVPVALVLVAACARTAPVARVELSPAPIPTPATVASAEPASAPPAPPAASTQPALLHFHIRSASTTYDFRLSLREDCSPERIPAGICEAPGELAIWPKGSDTPLQRVQLESIDVIEDDRGQPLVNSSHLYDYQGTLEVGDFDFDGHEDFAVQDSQDGPYGGPTFQVYLYRPKAGRFVLSGELSNLTRATLGFFQVDPARQRLTTFAKSGCCYHVTEQYRVVRGAPAMVSRFTDDATGDDGVVETTEALRGGKWITSTRRLRR